MPDAGGELQVYVVELDVEGVAIVTVHAASSDEACELAETRARPADVTELDVVEVRRVVEVAPIGDELAKAERARARERASTGSDRGGQA